MVNPSTADATTDDATIRKVRGFAARFGWSKVIVGNVFAYRATDISELEGAADPIGPENEAHLHGILSDAQSVVCAWGTLNKLPFSHRERWRLVAKLAHETGQTLQCLGTVKDGHPRHPLMISYSVPLEVWFPPAS